MTEINTNSKFFQCNEFAITNNNLELLKELWALRDYTSDNLEVYYQDDPELFEQVIRRIVRLDLLYGILGGEISILNCPEEQEEYCIWFVKFFGYLESTLGEYHPGYIAGLDQIEVFTLPIVPPDIDLLCLKFRYKSLIVRIIPEFTA